MNQPLCPAHESVDRVREHASDRLAVPCRRLLERRGPLEAAHRLAVLADDPLEGSDFAPEAGTPRRRAKCRLEQPQRAIGGVRLPKVIRDSRGGKRRVVLEQPFDDREVAGLDLETLDVEPDRALGRAVVRGKVGQVFRIENSTAALEEVPGFPQFSAEGEANRFLPR